MTTTTTTSAGPTPGRACSGHLAIRADGAAQGLRVRARRPRDRPGDPAGGDRRVPRPQRRRQDHDDRHDPRPLRAHRRLRHRPRADPRAAPSPTASSPPSCRRRAAQGHHRPRDPRADRLALRPPRLGRLGDEARGHLRHRRPSGHQVLRRPAAAAAVRHGPAVRPGAAHPRRAHHRAWTSAGGATSGRPSARTRPAAGPSSSRRTTSRRPTSTPTASSSSARASSWPTAPPPRSRPWPPAERVRATVPGVTAHSSRRSPGPTPLELRGETVLIHSKDSDAVARLPAHPDRRPRRRDRVARHRGRLPRPHGRRPRRDRRRPPTPTRRTRHDQRRQRRRSGSPPAPNAGCRRWVGSTRPCCASRCCACSATAAR